MVAKVAFEICRGAGMRKLFWMMFFSLLVLPLSANSEQISLATGQQQIYAYHKTIKRVSISDPLVAGLSVLSSRSLLITGKKAGKTDIAIWDDESSIEPTGHISIQVTADLSLKRMRLTAVKNKDVDLASTGDQASLVGKVDSLNEHSGINQALAGNSDMVLDRSTSSFGNQVQIDIKIVEVSRQTLMRAGFFFGKNNGQRVSAISSPGNVSGVEGNSNGSYTLKSSSGFMPLTDAFNVILGNAAGVLSTISLLEANGAAYTLAEPSLTALSGQSASFLAGGEFPIPMRNGSGADSSISVSYKEYGVRLMLSPTVLDENRIFLKVSPEVSELDFSNAVQSGGVSVPGLRVHRTDTSVSLGDGESFVISGLISKNTINNVDKLPWLGDIPILGAFFRSSRIDREDKELLMVVTPHLVRPLAKQSKLPPLPGSDLKNYRPSFSEFFFQSRPLSSLPGTGMSR